MGATLQFLRQRGTADLEETYAGRQNDKKLDPNDPAPNIKLEHVDQFGRKMTPKQVPF